MNLLINNKTIKKIIIIFITFIMISNFIFPNYAYAVIFDPGEAVVNGLCYLFAWAGDAVITVLQKIMITNTDISRHVNRRTSV